MRRETPRSPRSRGRDARSRLTTCGNRDRSSSGFRRRARRSTPRRLIARSRRLSRTANFSRRTFMWGCRTSSARAAARVATSRLRTTRRPRRARTPTGAASRRGIASSRSSAASPDSRTCRSCRLRGKSACARRIASSARRQSPSVPILTASWRKTRCAGPTGWSMRTARRGPMRASCSTRTARSAPCRLARCFRRAWVTCWWRAARFRATTGRTPPCASRRRAWRWGRRLASSPRSPRQGAAIRAKSRLGT